METLILRGCDDLLMLPKGMKYMKNLQYLDIRECSSFVGMPAGMGQLTRLQTLSFFIVDQVRGCQIKELQKLNLLQGELSIKRLDNVTNLEDANSANLKSKEKLSYLSLYWDEGNLPENAEEVLEGLEPHPNLKVLDIYKYPVSRLPNWMNSGLVLENLVQLNFTDCERCEDVPSLGKLRFLRFLRLASMPGIRSLNNNFHGDGGICFPALEELTLLCMMSLEEWKTTPGSVGGQSFPCLRELYIWKCPKLSEMPSHLPRLESLAVNGCNQMLIGQVMNLTSISSLDIGITDELMVLPNGGLKNHERLKSLTLHDLSNLKTLSHELDNLTSLESLSIYSCASLEGLPEGLKNLKSLENLELRGCNVMESLTEGVRHLTALKRLTIPDCPEMKRLPDGLRSLSELKELYILDCPRLKRRCKKDTGKDWPNISHITSIYIDLHDIKELDLLTSEEEEEDLID